MMRKSHKIAPLLFVVFNRVDTTRKVFNKIKKVKPTKLFIAADGPREDRPGEKEKCKKVRDIINDIDWDCEVKTLYRDKNLGCKKAISSAIDWFFENVENGIILEDDCLPHISFFRFASELLKYYKDDDRIMHISGSNFLFKKTQNLKNSYYFSKYAHIWGWATWKRAWKKYDVNMKSFPEFKRKNLIKNIFRKKNIQKYWMKRFEKSFSNRIDTWDYQWLYTLLINNGLSVVPGKNLIHNIGFNEDATHTTAAKNSIVNNLNNKMEFPIIHPELLVVNKKIDEKVFNNRYLINKTFVSPLKKIIKKIIPKRVIDLNENRVKRK